MPSERHLILESPEMHFSPNMQTYIAQEVARPCKQWIHEVLVSQREAERVKLRTKHFVLLPDVDTIPNQVFSRLLIDRQVERWNPSPSVPGSTQVANATHCTGTQSLTSYVPKKQCKDSMVGNNTGWLQPIERRWRSRKPPNSLHWLAVATDTSLRTLRDLRGQHIPMLISLYTHACQKIHDDMGIPLDQIMAYVHYPPSVYQLHIHFKHPIAPHVTHDSFRIHPLASVINNLKIDSDYYAKSILQLPVYSHTELYTALGLPNSNHKILQIQTQPYVPETTDTEPVEKSSEPISEWTAVNTAQHKDKQQSPI
jgi:hypothetical protein